MDIPQHFYPKKASPKEYAITSHYVRTSSGVTPEMALDPYFWQHLAAKFRVEDEVTVRAEDGSFRLVAEVVAIDPMKHWAQLRPVLLTLADDLSLGAPDNTDYAIAHDVGNKYRILRGRDVVEHGFATEAEARARLVEIKADGEAPLGMKRKVA